MIRISIVTVCYNAEKTIENTIESIINQTYKNIEYIIIDGKSTDNTNLIIENNLSKLNLLNKFVYISESDNGIYDAMNKAIKLATGEWLIFINSDDSFYSNHIIDDIFSNCNDILDNDIIYGDTNLVSRYTGSKVEKSYILSKIYDQMPFCHQSVFVKRNILEDNLFDIKYKICADYKFFLLMYMQNRKFYNTNKVISNFSIDGVSGSAKLQTRLETMKILLDLKPHNKNWIKFYFDYIKLRFIFHIKNKKFRRKK